MVSPSLLESLQGLSVYLCAILVLIVVVLYFITKSSRRAQRHWLKIRLIVVALYFMTNSAVFYTIYRIWQDPKLQNIGVFMQIILLLAVSMVLTIVYATITEHKFPEKGKERSVNRKKHDQETPIGVTKRKNKKG